MQPSKWGVWPWNWRKVRKANISDGDREIFERYGEAVVASILASNPSTTEIHAYIAGQDYEPSSQGRRREARDWLTECRDAHERREQRLETIEIGVVALITIEIFLSLLFGFLGLREGWKQKDALDKQVTVLDQMNKNTADTAAQIQRAADAQTESTQLLKVTNDKLQASLTTTGSMASATRKQLNILEQEQAARIAELAKKPKLNLYIGHAPLIPGANIPQPLTHPAREETDTSVTFDADLVNEGSAPATKPLLRAIVFGADVSFQPNAPFSHLAEQPNNPLQTYLIPTDTIRPHVDVRITLTFSFSRGHAPFQVLFNVDADEIQTGTPLGILIVTPRTPAN